MRKYLALGAVALLALSVTAVAMAVTNTYTVDGSTSPTKAGSTKKPVPIGINFDYEVGEVNNQRPDVIKKYSIRFRGVRVYTPAAPGCSKATLDNEGPTGCPAKSIVGTGFIENETGNRADPNDKSVSCNASVQVINEKKANAGNLYVAGSPNSTDPRTKCAIELAAADPVPLRQARERDRPRVRGAGHADAPAADAQQRGPARPVEGQEDHEARQGQDPRLLRGHRRLPGRRAHHRGRVHPGVGVVRDGAGQGQVH